MQATSSTSDPEPNSSVVIEICAARAAEQLRVELRDHHAAERHGARLTLASLSCSGVMCRVGEVARAARRVEAAEKWLSRLSIAYVVQQ